MNRALFQQLSPALTYGLTAQQVGQAETIMPEEYVAEVWGQGRPIGLLWR